MVDKKYPRSSVPQDGETSYVSWGGTDKKAREHAIEQYSAAVPEFASAAVSSRGRDFSSLTTRLSGRPGLRQSDYDYFRPSEAVPVKPKEIIAFARKAYRRIGLIRNAIDLMGDFACQGIRLVHPNPRIEQFYNDWFNRTKGTFVSERLCNLLFREANVPIRMKTAKINAKKKLEMQRSVASVDMEAILNGGNFRKGEIPWQYTFLDPLNLEVVGGPVSSLTGDKRYKLKLPGNLKRYLDRLKRENTRESLEILKSIPEEIRKSIEGPDKAILLPPEKTFVYYYKKDDWQQWADPMTYACFDDLILYEKLKLADKAALDGAVNKIRVWKLGNLEHKLAPTANAATALSSILGSNVGGGTMDVIWGPDIELVETSSDVQRFLGDEKYKPTLMSIYSCLGIPPTLTGTFGASGTTNNFISLKTLTERLNYVRSILLEFWNHQIKLVQNAMGFKQSAQVEFDFMHLDDPASMMQLLVGLADRNIISDEYVQRQIKAKPKIELDRLRREEKKRDRGTMSEKISPYHAVDKDFSLEKIALQTGVASPAQVGLSLKKKPRGEESALQMRNKKAPPAAKEKDSEGGPGEPGRPKNSNDKTKRKKRTFKPATKARIELWAKDAQETISELVNPALLKEFNKKNMRSLSREEKDKAERAKFEILCNLDCDEEVSMKTVASAIQAKPIGVSVHTECDSWILQASEDYGRRLTIDEVRSLRAAFYAHLVTIMQ
jgi:hypothetical protein